MQAFACDKHASLFKNKRDIFFTFPKSIKIPISSTKKWRHDVQQNDAQYNNTQYNDTQYKCTKVTHCKYSFMLIN